VLLLPLSGWGGGGGGRFCDFVELVGWTFFFVNVAAEECVLQTSQQVDEKIMWGVWN
jgi:hypothetical protein